MRRLALLLTVLLVPAAHAAEWSAPQTVTVEGKVGSVDEPQAEIDDRGRGVVVYQRQFNAGPDRPVMFAADVRAGGAVGRPRRISAPGGAVSARLDVAADGQAAVVYTAGATAQYEYTGEERVMLVTRRPGGRWSRPRELSRGNGNYAGDVVIEPSGAIVAAWKTNRSRREQPHVEYRRVTRRGTLRPIVRLPDRTTKPRLAASDAFPKAALAYLVNRSRSDPRTLRLRTGDKDYEIEELQNRNAVSIAAGDELVLAWGWYSADDVQPQQGVRAARVTAPGAAPAIAELDSSPGTERNSKPSVAAAGDNFAVAYADAQDQAQLARGTADPVTLGGPGSFSPLVGVSPDRTFTTAVASTAPDRNTIVAQVDLGTPIDLLPPGERLVETPLLQTLDVNRAGAALVTFLSEQGLRVVVYR